MASLQKKQRKGGEAFLVQFVLNRELGSLYIDKKYALESAEEIMRIVAKCVDAIETDEPLDRRTQAWLESMNDDLRTRFVNAGLVEEERDESMTLDQLF